jgi:putrescine:ornithine antiporter
MMKKAAVPEGLFRRNTIVAVFATLYSTYAIYASGLEPVMGGMIVIAITYIIYGFLAPRFLSAPAAAAAGPAR